MTLKTIYLTGTAKAGSGVTRLDYVQVPNGHTYVIQEVRPYFSASTGAIAYIYHQTELLFKMPQEVIDKYNLPIPADREVASGQNISLEAENAGASDNTIIVMLIIDDRT